MSILDRDLRHGFRTAGMRAEMSYLAAERFNGEAMYWREAEELRRKIKYIVTPKVIAYTEPAEERISGLMQTRLEGFYPVVESWCKAGETLMTIFFEHGFIKRIES
jgi:hypothetical protein